VGKLVYGNRVILQGKKKDEEMMLCIREEMDKN